MIIKQSLVDYIKTIIFLTDEQLALVLERFKYEKFQKHALLVNEGQVSRHMNFIVKGCLRIFFIKEDGQETTRHLAFEQQFATGLASFITESPSFEYIQAM